MENLSESSLNKSSSTKPKNELSMKKKFKDAVLRCEWNMCIVTMQKMEKFLVHIAGHAAAANGKMTLMYI